MGDRSLRRRAIVRPTVVGVLAVVIALVSGVANLSASQASATGSSRYLLAVGDSLAAGYQPTDYATQPPIDAASGFRDQGYRGSYAAGLATSQGLTVMDLACPGETTASMLATPAQGLCGKLYADEFGVASQISAAESFLSRHRGHVALVTIDIGANDLDHC